MTPAEARELAALFPAFAWLTGTDGAAVAERIVLRRIPAGTAMLHEGDSCTGMALVLEGSIRVTKTSPSGREITLYHVTQGETCVFSASCLLVGSHYPANAVVVENVVAAFIPADVFSHLFETRQSVRMFVLDHFAERLATTMALVEEVAFRRVDQRAARWLAEAGATSPVLTMSHDDIAAHLGTARVVVSRILGEFQSRGWLQLGRRRVELLDLAALSAFGNQSD